jgi:predicted nucleic acid-binding protein
LITGSSPGWLAPREPSAILVVDANIILGVVLGRRSGPVFRHVVASRRVMTSARAAEEVRRVLVNLPIARDLADALLGGVGILDEAVYADLLNAAGRALNQAVASRNGTTEDAHLLACAWVLDADVWSHDRGFGGVGWPSWSSANLMDALQVS